jgi:energy-coupling factor transporter transmembrane protein EcfT
VTATPTTPSEKEGPSWSHRLAVWGGVVLALLVAGFIAAAFIPRWWAHRVGDQANESFAGGIMLGLFYGFVFTVLPIALIVWGIRKRRSARAWLFIVGGALLLALPNLFTLGIVLGRNNAARAGDRTLDVEAPGFRGASLAGALLAFAAVGFVWYLLSSRRRAKAAEQKARAELKEQQEQAAQAAELRQPSDAPVSDQNAGDADPDQ